MFSSRFLAGPALALSLLALGATALTSSPVTAEPEWDDDETAEAILHGEWQAGIDDRPGDLWMSFRAAGAGRRLQYGSRIPDSEIEGLDRSRKEPHAVTFRVKRDAGTIVLRGDFDGKHGEGTYDLELDPAFVSGLKRRGLNAPTRAQHAELLLAGAGFDLLDALAREKYETPATSVLVRMARHGVNTRYVQGLAAAGYRLGSISELVRARDHGVDPSFIRGMAEAGYRNVEFDLLLRARDHGADPDFAESMTAAGYRDLPLETLIRARDHGVDGTFVEHLKRAGFEKLTLEEAIRARDHGVSALFARRVREKYPDAQLADVIHMRDRGEHP